MGTVSLTLGSISVTIRLKTVKDSRTVTPEKYSKVVALRYKLMCFFLSGSSLLYTPHGLVIWRGERYDVISHVKSV